MSKPTGALAQTLAHAVTRYDRAQVNRRHYNPHALAIYLQRTDDICADVKRGADVREAVRRGFTDRLRDAVLRYLDTVPPIALEL